MNVQDLFRKSKIISILDKTVGDLVGKCSFCQEDTKEGRDPAILGSHFTTWRVLQGDEILCPLCSSAIKWRPLIMNNWIATENRIEFIHNSHLMARILEIASSSDPFFIYSTFLKRKQGWNTDIWAVNEISVTNSLQIVFEESTIRFDSVADIIFMREFVRTLDPHISRSNLVSLDPNSKELQKVMMSGLTSYLQEAKDFGWADSPAWNFVVSYSYRYGGKK